jgi:hypothetical protein
VIASAECPQRSQTQTRQGTNDKTVLRVAFEAIAGERSDRQWRRIKCKLKLSDRMKGLDLLERGLPIIRTYAYLRLANGNQLVTREDVLSRLWIDEFAKGISGWIEGSDLVEVFNRLSPAPSKSTLRNWGKEIGCPLASDRWYSPLEVRLWISKLGAQTKFKFASENCCKKIGA